MISVLGYELGRAKELLEAAAARNIAVYQTGKTGDKAAY